jgi:hypothetical protein
MFQQPFRCQHLPRTNLGVGLRWPCRGQTCGGVLGPFIDQIFLDSISKLFIDFQNSDRDAICQLFTDHRNFNLA